MFHAAIIIQSLSLKREGPIKEEPKHLEILELEADLRLRSTQLEGMTMDS